METAFSRGRFECAECLGPLSGDVHAVRVDGALRLHRRYTVGDFLICSRCHDGHGGRSWKSGDGVVSVGFLYGGTLSSGVAPCERCGLNVERGVNPRAKSHTCSRACTVALCKSKSKPPAVARACDVCGNSVEGRADRRYCSGACRQRAHRWATQLEALGVARDEARDIIALGDDEAVFERALTLAREDGDMSRENVVNRVRELRSQ